MESTRNGTWKYRVNDMEQQNDWTQKDEMTGRRRTKRWKTEGQNDGRQNDGRQTRKDEMR